ncbi:MAG: hypothetical protein EB084_09375 [Proteobacteria bacterium]|nr:hypothetical protein [Pseudomonadota bacterium]
MKPAPASDAFPFDPAPAKVVLNAFVSDMGVDTLRWAWEVTCDTVDVVAHHSTPAGGKRAGQKAILWFEWFDSFLNGGPANHVIHGLAREVLDACPDDLQPALRKAAMEAFVVGDTRTAQERAALSRDKGRKAEATPSPLPAAQRASAAPTPKPNPFTVILGGKAD